MTLAMWGAVLGGVAALGCWMVIARLTALRRTDLATRVLPYLRDLPATSALPTLALPETGQGAARGVFGPVLRRAADGVERVLGGATSVRRRLQRAGLDQTVHDFRVEQVLWGLVAFGVVGGLCLIRAFTQPGSTFALAVITLCAFAVGVMAKDYHLSAVVKERERQMVIEFPVIAELLALAVAAGEGPVAALDRVVGRSRGVLSQELAKVLAEIRTGMPLSEAFDQFAARTGLPLVSRFAEGIAVAVERGTPLADVLHAQAADVREAGRRELIESGARKEVLMMVPVVFLVLPVTVMFAFWPGVIGLRLMTG